MASKWSKPVASKAVPQGSGKLSLTIGWRFKKQKEVDSVLKQPWFPAVRGSGRDTGVL